MPFEFTYILATFQHIMNDVFCEFLDDFIIYYLKNILIYSKNIEEYELYVCCVL